VIWGIFARLVFTYHCTWLVNSASHAVGYQTFKTGDRSTNNWWVALLTFGEGWHNNHHAFPFSARHGLRWFEIDPTWITIKLMSWLRIARNVKLPSREMMERLKAGSATQNAA
jgi:stearoyl-CoA desaturase (delta-9 desaturase)